MGFFLNSVLSYIFSFAFTETPGVFCKFGSKDCIWI